MLRRIAALLVGLLGSLVVLMWIAFPGEVGKAPSYALSMRTDLRGLVTAQEAYSLDHGRYFAGTLTSGDSTGLVEEYCWVSPGVTVAITATNSGSAWSFNAVATHSATEVTCAVYALARAALPVSHGHVVLQCPCPHHAS